MNRAGVTGLGLLAALLLSGAPRAPEAQPLAPPEVAPTPEFGEQDVAKFLQRVNRSLSARDVGRISAAVLRYSGKYGLDPLLVTQVLWVESGARPWVRSPLGAIGLMQVMPHIARPLGLAGSLASIESNIEAGCWILADNIRRLGVEDGISAYFWGSNIRSVAYLHRVREARTAIRRLSES